MQVDADGMLGRFVAPKFGRWVLDERPDAHIAYCAPISRDNNRPVMEEIVSVLQGTEDRAAIETAVRTCLEKSAGFFAAVIRTQDYVVAVVDRICSIPVVWSVSKDGLPVFSQTGDGVLGGLGRTGCEIDLDQALSVALSGFTIGAKSIDVSIKPLLPGEFLVASSSGTVDVHAYHKFSPWEASSAPKVPSKDEVAELETLTLKTLESTIEKADGRMIAVPLSAGLDSRLIASGLKVLKYDNVVCFAYGRRGNHEAETSRIIAGRLGYPWHFVAYDNRRIGDTYQTSRHHDYLRYADSLRSVHFPQDYLAVTQLLEKEHLSDDCILVNGQSGDFITGNHIPASLSRGDEDLSQVYDALIAKHFKQFRSALGDGNNGRIASLLDEEIRRLIDDQSPEDVSAFGLYEASEFIDRQSKYVINGQRCYEFLGLDWDLPLWHDDYLNYWHRQPLPWKLSQDVYRKMLMGANWAGVWQDIPANRKTIKPDWIVPLRFALKAMHAPFGRNSWHRFERRFLEYFMTPLCGYGVTTWWQNAMNPLRPWTPIAPHIANYLAMHGVDPATFIES